MEEEAVLSHTESVCPECLTRIPARRVADGNRVLLRKTCPEHGRFETVIWRGEPSYLSWSRPKSPSHPKTPQTAVAGGCPWDCGLCPDHRQQTCCTLVEVTHRCNLGCPVCYADAGQQPSRDPDLAELRRSFEALLAAAGPCHVQLSGGEPTVRDDLPAIITLGREVGFDFIQLNTNGLRLAREPDYVRGLKEAGLSCVFLQFDGLDDEISVTLRGRPLSEEKEQAVAQCRDHELGVILVPTLVPGVNTHCLGAIIEYALERVPGVRGVHFQPVSYFGRYAGFSGDQPRFTIPEIITEIEKQTKGLMKAEHFRPPGAEHSSCSFHGNFVLMPGGELRPWSLPQAEQSCCGGYPAGLGVIKAQQFQRRFWTAPADSGDPVSGGPSLGGWDLFLERVRTHSLCISGMAFQDAWTLDLERLKGCHLHVLHPDGRLIPFCAYNLTDRQGYAVYRSGARTHARAASGNRMPTSTDHGAGFQRDGRSGEGDVNRRDLSLPPPTFPVRPAWQPAKQSSGCLVCGSDLRYTVLEREQRCFYCGKAFSSNSACERGHYVCDRCHLEDGIGVIRHICRHSGEADLIRLFARIRQHPAIPVNGPEHHPMVAGIILAGYRNVGGKVPDDILQTAISRGSDIAGGACAFMGVCGAAAGVGIALSLLLQASPLTARERQTVQRVTQEVLRRIAQWQAARCCQREGWIALSTVAELSGEVLPIPLKAEYRLVCSQRQLNRECLGQACPLFPGSIE